MLMLEEFCYYQDEIAYISKNKQFSVGIARLELLLQANHIMYWTLAN